MQKSSGKRSAVGFINFPCGMGSRLQSVSRVWIPTTLLLLLFGWMVLVLQLARGE
jgi:hypothetical protein